MVCRTRGDSVFCGLALVMLIASGLQAKTPGLVMLPMATDRQAESGVTAASVDVPDPWVITQPVRLTSPADLGNVIVADGGVLEIESVGEPGIRFSGHLWVIGNGRVRMAYSVIEFLSTYHGQYQFAGIDQADMLVEGCTYRIPSGVQHGLTAGGNARMTVRETDFGQVQLTATDSGFLDASRLNGHFEVILQKASEIRLTDIPRAEGGGDLWVWTEHPSGSVAEFSPPLPGFVEQWSFPPPESSGIPQRCTVTRCQALLWPTLVYPGADMLVHDIPQEHWVVIGFHLPESLTITGVNNDEYVADGILPLSDRLIRLQNAQVDTWNFYPEKDAYVVIRDSHIGEALTFETSLLELDNCLVDGTGGFVGSMNDSMLVARQTKFTCDVQAVHQSIMTLDFCDVSPHPNDPDGSTTRMGAYDQARLVLNQTPYHVTPDLGGAGALILSYLSQVDPWPPQPGDQVAVHGGAALIALENGPVLDSWRLEAVVVPNLSSKSGRSPDVQSQLVGHGTQNVIDAELGTWTPEITDSSLDALQLHWEIVDSDGHTFRSHWPQDVLIAH